MIYTKTNSYEQTSFGKLFKIIKMLYKLIELQFSDETESMYADSIVSNTFSLRKILAKS